MTQSDPPREEAEAPTPAPTRQDSLRLALRRARSDDAERSGARAELRAARIGRLELLQDALQPLLAQIPAEVDMFDVALVPSADPRLFIDMVGFVEMGRDARLYLFQQDTRHGRVRVAESESLETMVDAVTDYVARRLLERDKALAADARHGEPVRPAFASPSSAPRQQEGVAAAQKRASRPVRWLVIAFAFLIDLLGAVTLFTLLGVAGWYLWGRVHGTM